MQQKHKNVPIHLENDGKKIAHVFNEIWLRSAERISVFVYIEIFWLSLQANKHCTEILHDKIKRNETYTERNPLARQK